jgi:hypothetical protein
MVEAMIKNEGVVWEAAWETSCLILEGKASLDK